MHDDLEMRRSSAYSQLAFGVFVLRWVGEGCPGLGARRQPSWINEGEGCPGEGHPYP